MVTPLPLPRVSVILQKFMKKSLKKLYQLQQNLRREEGKWGHRNPITKFEILITTAQTIHQDFNWKLSPSTPLTPAAIEASPPPP